MRHRPYLARQRDLAQHHRLGRDRALGQRRDQRRRHRQVRRRIGQLVAARDVQIDLGLGETHARAGFQHRQQHRQPPAVPPNRRAPRGSTARQSHDQRLDLDQYRPRALERGEDGGAADRVVAPGEEQGARVGHLRQARAVHREHADLVGPAEAILDCPQDAILVAALAFKAQHRIDHMLKDARPGDRPVLGDVANQDQHAAIFLGVANELLRRCADLADRAGRPLDKVRMHGLDAVDDQQRGRRPGLERGQDVAHAGDARQLHRRAAQPEPERAQPNLVDRFLARDIDRAPARLGHRRRHLQQQGRLADPGIARQQHRRARHQPAADRPVEFRDPAAQPLGQRHRSIQPDQLDPPPSARKVVLLAEHRRRAAFLHQRVPLGAVGALPLPARLFRPTGLADVSRFQLGHRHPMSAAASSPSTPRAIRPTTTAAPRSCAVARLPRVARQSGNGGVCGRPAGARPDSRR